MSRIAEGLGKLRELWTNELLHVRMILLIRFEQEIGRDRAALRSQM
jgi:hypothetical protein